MAALNQKRPQALVVDFDDMETSEHTKLKPLSITLAVESKTRRILDFQVSQMPAKGHLAKLSRKKYGRRLDLRPKARDEMFTRLSSIVNPTALIKSDENPQYFPLVRKHFPQSRHVTYRSRRACVVGQGELKKTGRDPLFSINHTCASFRANMNRLFRKTWCTTKKAERLQMHLALAALYHNLNLIDPKKACHIKFW
jgi:hypothetical protein